MKTILKTSMAILALGVSLQASTLPDPFAPKAAKPSRFAALAPVALPAPAPALTEADFLAAGSTGTHHVVAKATHEAIPIANIAGPADDLTGAHTHFPKARVQALLQTETTAKATLQADLTKMAAKADTLEDVINQLKDAKAAVTAAADLRELTTITSVANVTAAIDALKVGSVATVRNAANTADIDMTDSAAILAVFDAGGPDAGAVFAALVTANADAATLELLPYMLMARALLA